VPVVADGAGAVVALASLLEVLLEVGEHLGLVDDVLADGPRADLDEVWHVSVVELLGALILAVVFIAKYLYRLLLALWRRLWLASLHSRSPWKSMWLYFGPGSV